MADKECGQHAAFRYTWPGKDESFTCIEHAQQLINVANAIGMHLQLIPLSYSAKDVVESFPTCTQKVK